MKDNRFFWVQLNDGGWVTVRGAVALAKFLEPYLVRMEGNIVNKNGSRMERFKGSKACIRKLLEDPTAGVYERDSVVNNNVVPYAQIDWIAQVVALPPPIG